MADVQSVVIQSVLYGNDPNEIVRAAQAVANSAGIASAAGLISEWTLIFGDCSPEAVLDEDALRAVESAVAASGGTVEVVVFGENLGSAAGHNALAARSVADRIVILNPDAVVAPDCISVLAQTLVGAFGIVVARQVPLEHPKEYNESTGDTSWASTACAMTSRAAFDRVRGFDAETFFLYCDDVDYSWRLRLAGYRVVYQPAARVFHDKRLTVSADWPPSAAEIYYSAEAALFIAHKYSRPERVQRLEKQFAADGQPAVQKALAAFRARREAGTLPVPLDPDHRIAEFVKDNYAVHRF